MKWKKYTIFTTTEAEDLISLMLNENGVEGVQIEDNVPLSDADTKGMFIDILPELPPDDGSSRLSFFLRLTDDEHGVDGVDVPQDKTGASGKASVQPDEAKVHADNKACAQNTGSNEETAAADNTEEGDSDKAAAAEDITTADTDRTAAEDRSYSIDDRIWTEAEIAELLTAVRNELEEMRSYTDIGEGRIEEGVTEDTDWRDNWKQFFKPIRVEDFLIKPTWEEIPEELLPEVQGGSLKVIEIDPGTAFGTGSHETTQLCMAALKDYIRPGDRVLDIGTGSGILGIGALKDGAALITATELDEMCEASILDNIGFNDITEEQFKLIIGNVIGDENVIAEVRKRAPEGYDVVIANILAPVIAMLAAKGNADELIRKGGIFITSGIIDTRLDEVKAAFSANSNWEILKISEKGEWRSVIARRV